MAGKIVSRSASALPDSEKITVNVGFVDLGQVDLLVNEGFYASRSDFVRTAIRQQLLQHGDAVRSVVSRKTLTLGVQHFSREALEAAVAAGRPLQLRVLGLASFAADVSPKLARDAIESLVVLGALSAPADVKAALADRMR